MNEERRSEAPPSCPSARPGVAGAPVFGVVGGTVAEPRIGYLATPLPATPEILALAGAAPPGEVFRVAAPCVRGACLHFEGSRCRLAERVVALLPVVDDRLPPCRLRSTCVWWKQEGAAACRRCPQIVSESCDPADELVRAATP